MTGHFGTDPWCGNGVLRAIILTSGQMVLRCDEDENLYATPGVIRTSPPVIPNRSNDERGDFYDLGPGLYLKPGSWRSATQGEIERAGWGPYQSVNLVVLVEAPREPPQDAAPLEIGASTTEGDLRSPKVHSYLALKRIVAGKEVSELILEPLPPRQSLSGLLDEQRIQGVTVPSDGSEGVRFVGRARRRESLGRSRGPRSCD